MKESKYNLILKYFNNINETTIQCSICFKNYLKPFHTDTIRKHFSIKHKEINDQIRNRIQSTRIPPDNNNRIQSTGIPPDNNNRIQSTGNPPDNNNRIQSTGNPPDNNNRIHSTGIPPNYLIRKRQTDILNYFKQIDQRREIIFEDVVFNIGSINCIAKKMKVINKE